MKLLKFSAAWCMPCNQLKKELENFTLVEVEEINIDSDSPEVTEMMNKFNIRSIPTLVLMNENEPIWRHSGYLTLTELTEKIEPLIKSNIGLENHKS